MAEKTWLCTTGTTAASKHETRCQLVALWRKALLLPSSRATAHELQLLRPLCCIARRHRPRRCMPTPLVPVVGAALRGTARVEVPLGRSLAALRVTGRWLRAPEVEGAPRCRSCSHAFRDRCSVGPAADAAAALRHRAAAPSKRVELRHAREAGKTHARRQQDRTRGAHRHGGAWTTYLAKLVQRGRQLTARGGRKAGRARSRSAQRRKSHFELF